MIKNTNADCKIRDIKISGSTAYVTIIFSSSKATPEPRVFNFYIQDSKTREQVLLSNTNYWIDRYNNYDNRALNVDINMYKQIVLQIDITNNNKSDMINNKWVRNCYLVLVDVTDKRPINAWYSEELDLISKELSVPNIENLLLHSTSKYKLNISWDFKYESQEDFNYNNTNIYSEIIIKSPYTHTPLETIIMSSDTKSNTKKITCLNVYKEPILIEILLKNLRGDILKRKEVFYKPVPRTTNTYIKTSQGIKKVSTFFIKKEENENLYGINLNLASINVATLGTFSIYIEEEKDIFIINNESTFDKTEMLIELQQKDNNDNIQTHVLANVTNGMKKLSLKELRETYSLTQEDKLIITLTGTNDYYSKSKKYNTVIQDIRRITKSTLPSTNLLCSDTTLCMD